MSRARQNSRALLPASRGLLLADTEHAGRTWGAEWAVNLIGTCRHPSIHSLCSCSCSRTPVSPAHQEPRPPPAASTCCGPISFRTGTLPCCFFSSPCVLHPTCTKHVPGRCHQNTLCFGSPSTNRGTQLKRRGKNRVILILLPGPTHSIRAINSAGMRSACGAIVPAATGSSRLL
jgi:hypothetical protein